MLVHICIQQLLIFESLIHITFWVRFLNAKKNEEKKRLNQDLIETTSLEHYENYRSSKLREVQQKYKVTSNLVTNWATEV